MLIHTVHDHGDKREGLTSVVAVAECLSKKAFPQSLPLVPDTDPQPGDDCDWQGPARQLSRQICRQVAEIDLSGGERVEPDQSPIGIDESFGGGKSFALMLQGLGLQPVIHQGVAAVKLTSAMTAPQNLQSERLRPDDAAHRWPRIMAPSRFWADVSLGGDCSAFQNASCSSGLSSMV